MLSKTFSQDKYETFISYIEDVISIFDSQGFGYWEAVNFEKSIDLTGIDLTSKRVFRADEYPSLKDVVKVDGAAFLIRNIYIGCPRLLD